MDPISAGIAVLGLGLQLFGGSEQSKIASQEAAVSGQIAQNEEQIDQQKRMAMELDASRKSMEVLRNSQRARSMALYNSTTQGAQFGSGLQGGYGKISGETNVNLLGIGQNLAIGEKVFDYNSQIDQEKIQLASLGGSMASAQGISSIGSDIIGSSKAIGAFATQGESMFSNFFSGFGGGGAPSGKE